VCREKKVAREHFIRDRTTGDAYDTMIGLIRKNCLKKQIGLPKIYHAVSVWTLRPPIPTNGDTDPPNTCIATSGQTASVSGMVTIDSL